MTCYRNLVFAATGLVPALAFANGLEVQLERCAVLADPTGRLACYDKLAHVTAPIAGAAEASPAAAPAATPAIPVTLPLLAASDAPPPQPLSRAILHWELDPAAKRGAFNFRPHRDNYLLLANYSTSSNDAPFQDFTPAGIKAQHAELTYQLSFKVKLLEQAASLPLDLWFGYTQQSYWQAYNRPASSPFRETNYQPELIITTPLRLALGPLELRYANLGLVHQSNGQTASLSRSWNRIYGEVGAEHGDFGLALRLWHRLDSAAENNDNVDIVNYMGHGDLRATYRFKGNEVSLTARRNFHHRHGSLQFGWAFPIAANLKGYLQGFSGYGQSLIDYNYSQKSLGGGFLVDF